MREGKMEQGEPSEDALLTVKEYAHLRRVCDETVRRWLRAGKLEAVRTLGDSGHWRIKSEPSAMS